MRKYTMVMVIIAVFISCTKTSSDFIKYTFTYQSDTANKVFIAGSFNNWSATANPLTNNGSGDWKLEIELQPNYYQYKFVVDGSWIPDPRNDWKINDGGDNFNSIVKVGDPATPQRKLSDRPFPKNQLPEPVLETEPQLVDMYYAAWQMAWNKIQQGTPKNGFEPYYMDEGFNELIYQWDICFITSFAIYGRNVFPVMPSLDNFYKKQRADGYIQRVYWETNGQIANEPTTDEPMVNPPLFAWIEWRYYQISGDTSRFQHVLQVLIKYYEWTEKNCRTAKGKGLFYITSLGSGMDNTPRNNVGKGAWIDYSSQQALAALYISKIAKVQNDINTQELYSEKYSEIKTKINTLLWNDSTHFYYDFTENEVLNSTMHIGAFWTLISEVCTSDNLPYITSHLQNPEEFWRPHLIPTLAANQPEFDEKGHYWLGSVWAPTNYMVIKGLMVNNELALADSIAFNHLNHISDIYLNFKPEIDKIAFDERFNDNYSTLWECYSSELNEPATRWDNTFYSRQDFVGWTGLAPISLLIENVLGFDIVGKDNLINWNIKRTDKHGIKNILLGNQKVTLIFEIIDNNPIIIVKCEEPFSLNITFKGAEYFYSISKTETKIINL
ncbi:MAG: trehalase family glycosidase [Bacteroidota bacterium]